MNSKTIVRNTVWYGLENVISYIASFVTSIAVARTLGPSKMGYIVYVSWVITVTSSLGSVGIPATTRKYMAEFIGGGDRGTARFIYLRTLAIQAGVATIATVAAIIWVMRDSPLEYRTAALLLVASIWPSMVNFVSAQANVATEQLSANLPGSAVSSVTFFVMTFAAIFFHWGVIGICAAMFGMRLSDFLVRFFPTMRRVLSWPSNSGEISPELRKNMLRFASQSVAGMLLTLVVWDRSEMFLLKHLSPDIRQIAFYSVALGIADRLLIFPTVFAAATGASIFAQYGRDRSKLPSMTVASVRYLALSSIPVHLIATALIGPALLALYGKQYGGAVLVATVAPILCLPKAFISPIQTLFESTDSQKYFLITTVLASFVDIGVAWYFIPSLGAVGACIGSGVAQTTAVALMWIIGIRRYKIQLPWWFFGKLTMISAVTAVISYVVASHFGNVPGLVIGSLTALLVFLLLAYLFKMLEPEDLSRISTISSLLPRALAAPVNYTFALFSRRAGVDSPAG